MSKQPPPAPTASTIGPCPTIIQIVGRPGTGRSPRTIAPPDQPRRSNDKMRRRTLGYSISTPFVKVRYLTTGGGRVVRWCWVNFQCRGVLQFGFSRARAYCTYSRCVWGLFGHFYSHLSFFSPLSPTLWETVRYRLKYCRKGPLNPKQPTKI